MLILTTANVTFAAWRGDYRRHHHWRGMFLYRWSCPGRVVLLVDGGAGLYTVLYAALGLMILEANLNCRIGSSSTPSPRSVGEGWNVVNGISIACFGNHLTRLYLGELVNSASYLC